MTDFRQQRGRAIADHAHLERRGNVWFVPSQSSGGKYTVDLADVSGPTCSCPDYEIRGMKCKHIFAVECIIERGKNALGEDTIKKTVTVTETIKRPTYKQAWPAYNAAQTREKDKFLALLADLCRGIHEPPPAKTGRPRIPLADAVFAACFKVYSTFSGRRFMSDLRAAKEAGYTRATPHYNSIFNYLENPEVTPILRTLIVESSLPLRTVEVDFACDSSGFMSSRFEKWYDHKYGAERKKQEWVKAHIMCGVKTNIVTAVEIHDKNAADSPQLPALVSATAKNFTINEVSADKGYTGAPNHDAIAASGGTPFIAFRNNTTAAGGGLFEKMFHYFSFRRDEFLAHYHKRSNVESTFAMLKAKFGDAVRSKTDVAMKNEVLAKMVCHNIVCVVHEMYELNIEPTFWPNLVTANPPA